MKNIQTSLILRTKVTSDPDPPRIFWCATGPLSFLPLHAAGLYTKTEKGHKIFDYVTSSYTPTVTALLDPPRSGPSDFQGLLAVSQPSTPGQSRLPGTVEEVSVVAGHANAHPFRHLSDSAATVAAVKESMKERSWLHLACHAVQHRTEPIKSAFCLYDGMLELAEIIRNPLPHAQFAFLSACQTATGDEKLSDEAVHLAAGMSLAGYRSVIATMWSIRDADGPLVADKVYSYLLDGSKVDSTRSAHALHHAVAALRAQVGEKDFLSWVPFIHMDL